MKRISEKRERKIVFNKYHEKSYSVLFIAIISLSAILRIRYHSLRLVDVQRSLQCVGHTVSMILANNFYYNICIEPTVSANSDQIIADL